MEQASKSMKCKVFEIHFKKFPLQDSKLRYDLMSAQSNMTRLVFNISFLIKYYYSNEYIIDERIISLVQESGFKVDQKGFGKTAMRLFFQLCDSVIEDDIIIKYNPAYSKIMIGEINKFWDFLSDSNQADSILKKNIFRKNTAIDVLTTREFVRFIPIPLSFCSYFSIDTYDPILLNEYEKMWLDCM